MTDTHVHIPSEVLFQNPSLMGLDIETLRSCLLINKDWLQCINKFKKTSIEASFSKFTPMIQLPISNDNTAFRLCELYRFLTIIQDHIRCPDTKNINLLMNRTLFQKNITEDMVDVTLRILLNLQEYIRMKDTYENDPSEWYHVIVRVLIIGYTFQFIDMIYQSNLIRYTSNMRLKQSILDRGNILSQQIEKITIHHPTYKLLCNKINRNLRYTCRSVRKYTH